MHDEGHTEFEVAIERQLHGALDESGATRLAEHLVGCASCREYRRTAMEMERDMQASGDVFEKGVTWGRLKAALDERIGDMRTRFFLAPFILIGVFALIGLLKPGGPTMSSLLLVLGSAALILARAWQRLRQLEAATSHAGTGEALFEALATQRRNHVRRLWIVSMVVAPIVVLSLRDLIRAPNATHAAIVAVLFMGAIELVRIALRLRREGTLLHRD